MTKRILLLTQWFDPEPTFKGLVFARELVRQGFEVEVVTGFPNYPGGKLYPHYKIKWLQREIIDGVQITRVPLYPNHDQSAIKRILNYISFASSSLFYGLVMAKRADVIYAYHPPLTVGVTASLIKFFRRIPVVYDIQDMWPDTLRATGMIKNSQILNVVSDVCNWVYRHVDHIVVLSPGFKRLLIERGVPEFKIDVIYNWADEQSLQYPNQSLPDGFPSNDKFRILFAGTMGKAQALSSVLDAAEKLKTSHPNINFIFVGGGIELEHLKNSAKNRSLDNVIFLPKLPMNQIGGLLLAADVLLVHLKADPLFTITIPGKTQAYMTIGKPILMAVQGDAADLLKKADCAVEAISEDSHSIAQAALQLASYSNEKLSNMGENAKNYYNKNLAMTVGVSRFSKIFDTLIGKQ